MPTTVHALCLDLARESTSRVERYLLLNLALRAERVDLATVLGTPAMVALVGGIAPSLAAMVTRVCAPSTASTSPAN